MTFIHIERFGSADRNVVYLIGPV